MRSGFVILGLACFALGIASAGGDEAAIDFDREIRPLFERHCHQCHGKGKQESGLRLDLKQAAFLGGDSGAPLKPGDSAASLLLSRVSSADPESRMPPQGDGLSTKEIELLRAWIDQGAPWPNDQAGGAISPDHWSFHPPTRPRVPAVRYPGWLRNPIDGFILAKLDQEGVVPSPEADRTTLIRRITLDLLGLPPTPDEVEEYLADRSPEAYERLTQRLLDSPHFGERWGRHWLDQARYADSDGYEKDLPRPYAWRYRNWVIDAFNRDLPFDQFTIEQLAGDLLPNPTLEQRVATGFHRNTLKNREGGVDQEEDRIKIAKDRVQTTGTVWLGLSINCCECHSHKYDPLTQREYYQLFAFFNNADDREIPAPLPEELARFEEAKRAYDLAHAPFRAALASFEREHLPGRRASWESTFAGREANATGWQVIVPTSVLSAGGAAPTVLPDHSVLLGGENPDKDVLTLVLPTTLHGITGIRLEALPDDSLPQKGPGRSQSGNFVLSELRLMASPLEDPSSPAPVAIARAVADYSQKGFAAEGAIDGDPKTGWAVAINDISMHARRAIYLALAEPIGHESGSYLRLELEQLHGERHGIGRLRVSVTRADQGRGPIESLPPDDVVRALSRPSAERTEEESKRIADFHKAVDPDYRRLAAEEAQHARTAPVPPATQAQVLQAASSPRPTFIQVRGDFLRPGDPVSPGTPAALHPFQPAVDPPTRLDLARWLVDPQNPLTARVIVNRIWQNLHGVGLVATENDFGTQGERPTHPELLDWLATEFIAQGWSQKKLIALIVNSATYRQASAARPDLAERDPRNRWLAWQNRLRLSAEGVRDSYLATSGLLKWTIGGPSVRPPLPSGIAELGYAGSIKWETTQSDDKYRRGLYIFLQRTTPYPSLITFDAPDSNVTCTRRERSNTPLQALTTLNDPVFFECAQALGARVVRAAPADQAARVDQLFEICLSRSPTMAERERLTRLYAEARAELEKDPASAQSLVQGIKDSKGDEVEWGAWIVLARTVLNLDEFVTRE